MPDFLQLDDDAQEFEYQGVVISMATYGSFIRDQMHQWAVFHHEKICLGASLNVNSENLRDNRSDPTPLYSFVDLPQNNAHTLREALWSSWSDSGKLKRFYNNNTWNYEALYEWISDYNHFMEWTGAIFEWCLGMPARGEELVTTVLAMAPIVKCATFLYFVADCAYS